MTTQHRIRSARAIAVAIAAAAGAASIAASAEEQRSLAPLLDEQLQSDRSEVTSQERVGAISDETREMLLQYRSMLSETQSLEQYSEQLAVQVESQAAEIELVKRQLVEIEATARGVLPLMLKMLDTLDRFVELDLPFQLDERRKRVAALRDAMARADVTVSEKYRRILEAYQIETDYGRTLEAWQAKLGEAEGARTVRFVRIGRVALLYQTLDGAETGYWEPAGRRWVVDDSYRSAVRFAFAVADKSHAPDLLSAPIPAPVGGPS